MNYDHIIEKEKQSEQKEQRLEITIEEYNYNNYVEYINKKKQETEEETRRVIIIDIWL